MKIVILLILTVCVGTNSVFAQAARKNEAARCFAPGSGQSRPQLLPRDDAATNPGFLAFRRQLQSAVARKERAAILRIADPAIKLDFGGTAGIEALKQFMDDADGDFWVEFDRALAMGGTFDDAGNFSAPYVYSTWPNELDPFECAAVTGKAVRLRARPDTASRALGRLDHDIVQLLPSQGELDVWRHVQMSNGETGYVASRFVRSPVGYRALFTRTESGWRLTAFIAGD